jgi:hypothetical protein
VAKHWWLTPVILVTQEAEIRRIVVQSQLGQTVHETLSRKTLHKKKKKRRAGKVVHGVVPEFKPQYYKNRKKENSLVVVIHCCNSSTLKMEVGGSQVQGRTRLHQKKKK